MTQIKFDTNIILTKYFWRIPQIFFWSFLPNEGQRINQKFKVHQKYWFEIINSSFSISYLPTLMNFHCAPSIIHQMVSMAWLMLMQVQQVLSGFSASSQRSNCFFCFFGFTHKKKIVHSDVIIWLTPMLVFHHDYMHCIHKYLQWAKLLQKTSSIGRHLEIKPESTIILIKPFLPGQYPFLSVLMDMLMLPATQSPQHTVFSWNPVWGAWNINNISWQLPQEFK